MSRCRGMRSTPGSRRAANSSTTRRTRITGSTAGRPNRALRVTVAGTALVDTTDTMIVFETALAPVLYVAPSQVRTDLLRRTETSTLLQLQGLRDVLVGGHRRLGGRGHRMELRGPAARNPAHQGIFQLRRQPCGRRCRAPAGVTPTRRESSRRASARGRCPRSGRRRRTRRPRGSRSDRPCSRGC